MDLKRYVLGIVVLLVILFLLFQYASGGSGYSGVNTSVVASAIESGNVKSAQFLDKDNMVQITTKSGAKEQAYWVGNQGQALQTELQDQVNSHKLPASVYNVQGDSTSAWLTLLEDAIPWLLIGLFFLFMLNQMQGAAPV